MDEEVGPPQSLRDVGNPAEQVDGQPREAPAGPAHRTDHVVGEAQAAVHAPLSQM